MKRRIFIAAIVLLTVLQGNAAALWIDFVEVLPEEPLDIDIITFDVYGRAGNSSSWVEYDEFFQNGTSLQLDVYIKMGIQPAVSYWTYSREILPLPADTYTLEVRAFHYQTTIVADTYTVDFTVVPEPTSLVLFGSGLLIVRAFTRRKRVRSQCSGRIVKGSLQRFYSIFCFIYNVICDIILAKSVRVNYAKHTGRGKKEKGRQK